jgi:hypothetical protein
MSGSDTVPTVLTGAAAGLSGDEQVRIALQTIVAQDGVATMEQIRQALVQEVERRYPGATLSDQGYATLRRMVNTNAVQAGYVFKHDPQNPGWRVTAAGREFLQASEPEPEPVFNAETQAAEMEPPSVVRWAAFELHILDLMVAMHPAHAWYHQGRHTRNERGLDIIGDRVGDSDLHRIGAQVKLHKPNNEPSENEWQKFLAGCFVRRVHKAVFVTSGSLSSNQRREAGEGNIVVIQGRSEINRFAQQYRLQPFTLYDDTEPGTTAAP